MIYLPSPPRDFLSTLFIYRSPRFEIPRLPEGKELIINIKSTWGDRHYVGMNGIEVFTVDGTLAKIKAIRANPKDINVLPEYEGNVLVG